MSRTQHFLDCGCQNCVDQLLEDISKLEEENADLKLIIKVLEEANKVLAKDPRTECFKEML